MKKSELREWIREEISNLLESKKTFKDGRETITADVIKKGNKIIVKYYLDDDDDKIGDPITKKMLRQMKKDLGGGFTFMTNAGLDLHSSEVKNNKWEDIEIKRGRK